MASIDLHKVEGLASQRETPISVSLFIPNNDPSFSRDGYRNPFEKVISPFMGNDLKNIMGKVKTEQLSVRFCYNDLFLQLITGLFSNTL